MTCGTLLIRQKLKIDHLHAHDGIVPVRELKVSEPAYRCTEERGLEQTTYDEAGLLTKGLFNTDEACNLLQL